MQAAKEAFETKLEHLETIRILSKLIHTKGNTQSKRQCIILYRSSTYEENFQEFTV